MFRHKLHRTFIAMFWGWGVFILLLPELAWIVCQAGGRPFSTIPGVWVTFAMFSIPVVLVAWLLILFPVDCLVSESSLLRTRWLAACLGGICGVLPFFLLATYDQMTSFTSWWDQVRRGAADPDTWLYFGGAAITGHTAALHIVTGHTAALHIVLKHPRKLNLSP